MIIQDFIDEKETPMKEPLEENFDIISKKPLRDDKYLVEYCDVFNRFKTNYARIKPFILSFGRCKISQIMKPYISNILRVNTDGFYCDKCIKEDKGFGKLNYKRCCENGEIKSTNNKVGEFSRVIVN